MTSLTLFTPAGVLLKAAPLRLAAKRLTAMGFAVKTDEAALAKQQRFGGSDDVRLDALHRIAGAATASHGCWTASTGRSSSAAWTKAPAGSATAT
jgi:muramoyltetrapeptide carboxypeptidase LdcA involved in peptidoglycan recycling